jgi:hypothetical protein
MSHFAGADLPSSFGRGTSCDKTLVQGVAASAAGAIEGSSMLTYTVPVTGFYRLSGALRTTTVSTATTSAAITYVAIWNDGTAITTACTLNSAASRTFSALTAVGEAAHYEASMVVYATAGTDIVLKVYETISGSNTAWYYTNHMSIMGC